MSFINIDTFTATVIDVEELCNLPILYREVLCTG